MSARFILSLDCEGKWGVADLLNSAFHRELTDERLRAAYEGIVHALDEFGISATFAFVGAFAQPAARFSEIKDGLRALNEKAPNYLGPALADIDHGSKQGWHGDWAVDRVATAAIGHEIALHGFTHVPWTDVDNAFIHSELALWQSMAGPVRESRTFVYPRNSVAHLDLLADAGIEGYRRARPPISRLRSLASEFNVWTPPDGDPDFADSMIAIPAGYFVNWQHGPRRLVPRLLSSRRASQMLNAADRNNEVVHYWLHPENVASAPGTIEVLRDLLRLVAELREKGRCEVLNQAEYCESRRKARRKAPTFI